VERVGGEVIRVPLVQHAYDLDALAARVGRRTRLVIIGNPNNPTGLALSKAALDRFLNRLPHGPVVCLDEAYAEYAAKPDFPNSLDYIATGRSLLALRSLSRAYGLAGLRMGYAIAPEGLALSLNNQRQPFNTSSLAQIAALAALRDSDHLASTIALNASGRDWLATRLSLLGLFFLPSEANFLLVRVGDGARVYNNLRKDGVLVKQLDAFGLPEYIRVSVGSPGENARFIACLQHAIRA
jgi:histidinol-phosphate aminotransferase